MGFFDTLADVSTVVSPGLEAYGKGRLDEATTVNTLINQYVRNRVEQAKFDFDREKELEQRRQFGIKEARLGGQFKTTSTATEQYRKNLLALKRAELGGLYGDIKELGESGTALAEGIPSGGGGGFLGGSPPTPAPGIYQRGVDLIGSEAIPGPTAGDVISWIQSRLTPKYETQAPVTSKQSVQALREGILARGGSEEDVGTIFRVMGRRKNGFNFVADLLNKGVPVSEILSAREFRTAHHNR